MWLKLLAPQFFVKRFRRRWSMGDVWIKCVYVCAHTHTHTQRETVWIIVPQLPWWNDDRYCGASYLVWPSNTSWRTLVHIYTYAIVSSRICTWIAAKFVQYRICNWTWWLQQQLVSFLALFLYFLREKNDIIVKTYVHVIFIIVRCTNVFFSY